MESPAGPASRWPSGTAAGPPFRPMRPTTGSIAPSSRCASTATACTSLERMKPGTTYAELNDGVSGFGAKRGLRTFGADARPRLQRRRAPHHPRQPPAGRSRPTDRKGRRFHLEAESSRAPTCGSSSSWAATSSSPTPVRSPSSSAAMAWCRYPNIVLDKVLANSPSNDQRGMPPSTRERPIQ